MPFDLEMEAALLASQRAGELALRHRRAGVTPETKPDDSPVTLADRENEKLIAGILEEKFPQDGILGEEGARKDSRSGRRWIIDPIDGTRDFVRGNPLWAVLIGLEQDGEALAGVAAFPALGYTYSATRGGGAWRNTGGGNERIQVSGIDAIESAVLCVNGFNRVAREPYGSRLLGWMEEFWAVRSLGGALDAMLVASGQADAWIERKAEVWDLAPLQVIVEEAGGRFFDFAGRRGIAGGNAVACAPGLETIVKKWIAPERR
jgi:histidinol phosphatase-like enzyme (inositol monophosphatase family)